MDPHKLTVGIGHLIMPEDNLKKGDEISDERIELLFELDTASALSVSLEHWLDIGVFTAPFLAALISANFQLGDFSYKFKKSYPLLISGKYEQVIENLHNSIWMKQTPVRVNDFITAIRSI